MEDETYSLIFASLKHPIRRRILRMLAEESLTYSEILETLSIDSGHFSYHLENLGDLTYKDKKGNYRLSSFGKAAVKLMGGVEEEVPVSPPRRNKPLHLFAKSYPIVLVLILLFASVYFVSYVAAVPSDSETTRWAFSCNQSAIDADMTSDFDFTLAAASSETGKNSIDLNVGFEGTTALSQREGTFTGWYENSMWLEMSQTIDVTKEGLTGSIQVSNDTVPDLTKLPSGLVAKLYGPKIAAILSKTDFSQLSVDVYTPNGTVIADCLQRGEEPYTVNYLSILQSGWFVESSNTTKFRSYEIPIDQVGSYTLKITNDGDSPWAGKFSLYLKSERIERPYFYWGIAGLAVALGYLVFAIAMNFRRGESEQSLD
jgi:DNA-binding transcriptional ArsR family regulator